MKMLMCGKGGSGKSIVSAMLAKEFEARGLDVLVLDTDESNFGLHRHLGLPLPPDFVNYFGGREEVLKKIRETNGEARFIEGEWHFSDLPAKYVSEKGRIKLMSVAKIQEPDCGCACPFSVIAQQLISALRPDRYQVVIVDTEAGMKHFNRGTGRGADAVFMVVDPSMESMQLAGKVADFCQKTGQTLYFILNKVSLDVLCEMENTVHKYGRIAGIIPAYHTILQAGLRGSEMQADYDEILSLADFCQTLN